VAHRRLILDTGVLIEADRGRRSLSDVLRDDDDVAIAAVTVAELWEGVERADPVRRARRESFVSDIVDAVPVEDYDAETAIAHGRLLAHTRQQGKQRGAHDLIIAATAVATDRILVTGDLAARFDSLPGVRVLTLPTS
jgi:tRNA(fMet)-specific endonuclease VapC